MPGVKIGFDFSEATNNLRDFNQEVLELVKNLKLADEQISQILNRQVNKLWAQGVGSNALNVEANNTQNLNTSDDFSKQLSYLSGSYADKMHVRITQATEELKKGGMEQQEVIERYQSQQWNDVYKKQLDGRIGLENNFTDFLRDKLSEEYGLYKTHAGQNTDLWSDYYKSIKTMSDSWGKDINNSLSSVVFDSLKGNTEKAHQDWKNLLSSMNQDLIRAGLGMGEAWASANIFKPVLGSVMGVNQGQDDHSYGALGKDGVSQVGQSVSSYGEIGLLGGPMGAPFLLSRFPANNGLIGLLTGQTSNVSNTSNYFTSELAMAA
jgi:hypothetical protein